MAICPNCKTEQKKRVNIIDKVGECPSCGEEIILYDGYWIRSSVGSPTLFILRKFEEYVSKRLSTPSRKVTWRVPRYNQTYHRELGLAEQMLNQADGDVDRVNMVIDEIFTNEKFAWKNRESLASIMRDYSLADAIVSAKIEEENTRVKKQNAVLDDIMSKENIF